MRKKIIVWSSIICLVVLLVVISSIWQYNDKKPKYKYYRFSKLIGVGFSFKL